MKKKSEEFLKRLVNSIGPSGYEGPTANVWAEEARTFASLVERDVHGNTYAHINPGAPLRVMLAGHIDEIGFIITHIDDNGFIWVDAIGGWDPQIAQGQRVSIMSAQGPVYGVFGKLAIHLLSADARKNVTQIKDLWVDIGAKNKKDALKRVAIGDPLVIASDYAPLANGMVIGRGFDNRAGAFVVLEAARIASKLNPAAEIVAVATVQEEIGLRGATTAAHRLNPAVGIAVDVTFGMDHPSTGEATKLENDVKMGGGPVLTRGPNANAPLYDLLLSTAKKEKIDVQLSAYPRGTPTDANALQLSREGVATGLVSIPLRYMHSPGEIVSLSDLTACAELIGRTVARITPTTSFIPF